MSVFSFVVGELWFEPVRDCPGLAAENLPARNSTKLMIVTLQVIGDEIKRISSPF
jgi:hypothetical protein